MTADPRSVYSQLLNQRRAETAARERRHQSLAYARLAAVVCALAVIWIALAWGTFSILWVVIPGAVFIGLIVIHEHLLRLMERRRRAERYFERGLARLDGKWMGTGEPGDRYLDPAHPYAQDLDLFGKGSVFELLCTARTRIGEDMLANWLTNPASPETVRARQEAVNELRPRIDLREDLAVLAEEARTGVEPVALAAWGEAPPILQGGGLRFQIWIFTALGLAGFVLLWTMFLTTAGVVHISDAAASLVRDGLLLSLVGNGIFLYRKRRPLGAVVAAVEEASHELGLLSEVLCRVEEERFHSPRLAQLRAGLDSEGEPPSKQLARLKRLMEYLDSRDNVLVRVLEIFILWTPHLALKVEDWRRHSGSAVRRWLNAAGELEALCSLASHAFEHPGDPFPEFSETAPCAESSSKEGASHRQPHAETAPFLEAEAIGHPLLGEDRVVRNDVGIGGHLRLLVVSGSNMSGKSTMLRTLGVNAVLAQAGAPVRARRLRLSPLALGASIRVSDSLQGGVSRFYAEILRLRQILDLTARNLPVLFLIDEFLHGTNSHDRRIGAEALARGLVDRGAIGLITTHDLALAEVADALGERAANVHFEDQIENGQIRFDYRMRPGVVRKSNAIELMRQVGLEI